jgi:hypothetical protein
MRGWSVLCTLRLVDPGKVILFILLLVPLPSHCCRSFRFSRYPYPTRRIFCFICLLPLSSNDLSQGIRHPPSPPSTLSYQLTVTAIVFCNRHIVFPPPFFFVLFLDLAPPTYPVFCMDGSSDDFSVLIIFFFSYTLTHPDKPDCLSNSKYVVVAALSVIL